MLWFGGHYAVAGIVSVGTIVAFLTYVTRFFQPIQELSQLFTTLQAAAAGGERVLRLLDTPASIADAPDAVELPAACAGAVEFSRRDAWPTSRASRCCTTST